MRTLKNRPPIPKDQPMEPSQDNEGAPLPSRRPTRIPMRTKTDELGIFTIGIGIVFAALSLWLTFTLRPNPGRQQSLLAVVVTLAICAIYVVLGILTRRTKSAGQIQLTVAFVVLGFLVDLALGFSILKLFISGFVIFLIVKTGVQAIGEVHESTTVE